MQSRAKRIRQFRLRQPLAELQRKAAKSRERANHWTQEELDAADAEGKILADYFAAGDQPTKRSL